jgi:hypothetical protein
MNINISIQLGFFSRVPAITGENSRQYKIMNMTIVATEEE